MKIERAVKEIVSYVYQSGDLNMEYFAKGRAQLGTNAHQVVQKKYQKEECEVYAQHTLLIDEHEVTMTGRMDLLLEKDGQFIVGEIKSTTRKLDAIKENDRPAHYGQGKFYAYMIMMQKPQLENITVRLIYCDLDGKKTKSFDQIYTKEVLEDFVYDTLKIYVDWMVILIKSQQQKLATAKTLDFPFGEFRTYQRELSGSVYHCIKHKKNLLLRAPTGIGKTMATLYPSLKALTNGEQKIFYFTAKTMGRTVAEKAFSICQENGLQAKVTTITAKEKVCFMEEVKCDPAYCPYARGFFDRIRAATEDLFQAASLFDRSTIEAYAHKHEVCPFEFSLSMASISDGIIGDYNYLFDPRAYLRRFFEEESDHVVLIDEAHNLYDRACEMFSATLSKSMVIAGKKAYKGRSATMKKTFDQLLTCFESYEFDRIIDEFRLDVDYKLLRQVEDALETLETYLHRAGDSAARTTLINFYYELLQFSRISEYFTESFRFRLEATEEDFTASIICLNPGEHLARRLEHVKSAILFSATLHPLDYFHKILLNNQPAEHLFLPSPFQRENLDLRINYGISTKYKDRDATTHALAKEIHQLTLQKSGNYMIFFPSYAYMSQIYDVYENLTGDTQHLVMQQKNMSETDREDFLKHFDVTHKQQTLVAFAVLGGVFGEGIDLIGDALIGAVIVGVGLPGINPLIEERKKYFENEIGEGYRYAYIIPGFNKVMQAVGRVIRTETDCGLVLLIDNRYMEQAYLDLFPYEWQHGKFSR